MGGLHLCLEERFGLVVELVPCREADRRKRDGEADGHVEHVGRHLVPAGLESWHGTGDAAIDGATLQGGYDLGEGNSHAGCAERLGQVTLGCALHTDLLALYVGNTLDR